MKKILSFVLASVILILSVSVLGMLSFAAADNSKYLSYYEDVFKQYQKVQKNKFYKGKDNAYDLCPKFVNYEWYNEGHISGSGKASYCLHDLNKDGFPELIISDGSGNSNYILGIYTYTKKVQVIADSLNWGYRTFGFIRSNGNIAVSASGGADFHSWDFYTYKSNAKIPTLTQGLVIDGTEYYKNTHKEYGKWASITYSEFLSIFEKYTGQKDPYGLKTNVNLKWTNVSKVHSHNYKTTSIKKATLTANGKKVQTCSICGSKKTTTIAKASKVSVSATSYAFNGKVKKPTLSVKDSKGKAILKSNYTAKWSNANSKAIGSYTVTVTFKGNYSGSKVLTYKIVPGKVTGLKQTKVTATSVKLSWSKVTGAKYYTVQHSTDGKIWKAAASATTSNSYTIKNLKAGTKYYFRVRALDSTKKFAGAYSAVKNVTVKKTSALSKAEAKSLYKKAEKVASDWLFIAGGCAYSSWENSITMSNGQSAELVKHSKITSVAKLKKYLSNYFAADIYKDIVEANYKDIGGKLYLVGDYGVGDCAAYNLKDVSIVSQNSKTAKLKVQVTVSYPVELDSKVYIQSFNVTLKNIGGKWLFTGKFNIIWSCAAI